MFYNIGDDDDPVYVCMRGTNRLEGFFHHLREYIVSRGGSVRLLSALISEFIYR
jgi:hypothetical protein